MIFYLDWILFNFVSLLFHPIFSPQDQEQEGNGTQLHWKIFTKWYQKPSTLNEMVTDMQQATMIGYSNSDIIKSQKQKIKKI